MVGKWGEIVDSLLLIADSETDLSSPNQQLAINNSAKNANSEHLAAISNDQSTIFPHSQRLYMNYLFMWAIS